MGFSDIHQKPLKQEVEYDIEDHLIYGKQKGWKKVLEWIFTVIMWMVILSYIGYLIYGSLAIKFGWYLFEFLFYTREMVLTIQEYFFVLLIAYLVFIILLIFWKNYNYQKFGKLHRRTFQPEVSNDELSEMFELDKSVIEQMQSERYVVLETNIIPPDMGMGGKKKEGKE
ncbi:MAG: poly-beta-1,6-N-acetyl-D-glucosamine biosynthesis protein PgaD [Lachnospiraceae bacterium]|nr:poly-beta-1,6-N-acetyl-D-glucosamine biosynthesis protein PgaD [Lachnospiraceae bacterium]